MDLLRSLLLLPALDPDGSRHARRSHADAVVIDLDERIPLDEVEPARAAARAAVADLHSDHRQVWVRVHATSTLQAKADIRATVREGLSGFVLPDAQSANHVRYAEALLRDAEAATGLKEGTLHLIAMIASAAGLLAAQEITKATSRLVGLALDGAGFCADMGVERTRDGHELQYARGHIAVCARAAGIHAIDTSFPYTRETQGLLAEAAHARSLGLHGKLMVTPDQAPVINAVFRPTAEEIAYARRLHVAHEEARERGDDFAHIDGRIVDGPRARRARRLVELATAIEAKEQQAAI